MLPAQVNALGSVILVGMGTSLVSSSALFFFDDDCTLGDESEAINHSASGAYNPIPVPLLCSVFGAVQSSRHFPSLV